MAIGWREQEGDRMRCAYHRDRLARVAGQHLVQLLHLYARMGGQWLIRGRKWREWVQTLRSAASSPRPYRKISTSDPSNPAGIAFVPAWYHDIWKDKNRKHRHHQIMAHTEFSAVTKKTAKHATTSHDSVAPVQAVQNASGERSESRRERSGIYHRCTFVHLPLLRKQLGHRHLCAVRMNVCVMRTGKNRTS
jgi:hypothetical protein